jgi:hypothetical protein
VPVAAAPAGLARSLFSSNAVALGMLSCGLRRAPSGRRLSVPAACSANGLARGGVERRCGRGLAVDEGDRLLGSAVIALDEHLVERVRLSSAAIAPDVLCWSPEAGPGLPAAGGWSARSQVALTATTEDTPPGSSERSPHAERGSSAASTVIRSGCQSGDSSITGVLVSGAGSLPSVFMTHTSPGASAVSERVNVISRPSGDPAGPSSAREPRSATARVCRRRLA